MATKAGINAANALVADGSFSGGNTTVADGELRLHDKLIARKIGGAVYIGHAGWPTVTTADQLAAVAAHYGAHVRKRQGALVVQWRDANGLVCREKIIKKAVDTPLN